MITGWRQGFFGELALLVWVIENWTLRWDFGGWRPGRIGFWEWKKERKGEGGVDGCWLSGLKKRPRGCWICPRKGRDGGSFIVPALDNGMVGSGCVDAQMEASDFCRPLFPAFDGADEDGEERLWEWDLDEDC
jgi:hypothetical protein